jgi:hypothetical protein
MATVTATVKKDEDDTKADVVKVIKSSFEGKPVEARKAFDEAMMNKISAALALRTEEIKADIYEDCEYDKETDTPLKKSEKSESVDDEDEVDEELSDKQKKIDADGDGKIGANDLAKLRKESAASDEDDDDISEEDDDDEDDISEEDDDEDGKKAVNEVSSKALDNYGKAALNDVQKRRSNRPAGEGDESDPKIAKRLKGMEAQARKQEQQKG